MPLAASISLDVDGLIRYKVNDTEIASTSFNTPPNPPIIEGPQTGRTGKTYQYLFTLTDPDIDDSFLGLEVDFGGEILQAAKRTCAKPWYNGTVIEMDYKWHENAEYEIKARAVDSYGEWSNWSDPYIVSMPKTKLITSFQQEYFSVFFNLLFNYILKIKI